MFITIYEALRSIVWCVFRRFLSIWPWLVLVYVTVLVSKNLTLHHLYVLLLSIYTVIVYNCYMNTLISTWIFKCGDVLAFILLTVYINTHKYLYNAVHLHVHIFNIFANPTDTVRTASVQCTRTWCTCSRHHQYNLRHCILDLWLMMTAMLLSV